MHQYSLNLIENLESRRLLSASLDGDTLRVEADPTADTAITIQMSLDLSQVLVSIDVGGVVSDSAWDVAGLSKVDVLGGAGNDTIVVDTSTTPFTLRTRIRGGAGNDTITAGNGRNILSGGAGDDVITGGALADKIHGGSGNDQIDGGAGNDRIWGGDGDDVLLGGAGNDRIRAGSGVDILNGGEGRDRLFGDADDTFNDTSEDRVHQKKAKKAQGQGHGQQGSKANKNGGNHRGNQNRGSGSDD